MMHDFDASDFYFILGVVLVSFDHHIAGCVLIVLGLFGAAGHRL